MSTINNLIEKLKFAENTLCDQLRSEFPIGSECEVILRHGQKNPSVMTVRSYIGGRFGTVHFSRNRGPDKYKRWRPPFHKRIPYDRIIRRLP